MRIRFSSWSLALATIFVGLTVASVGCPKSDSVAKKDNSGESAKNKSGSETTTDRNKSRAPVALEVAPEVPAPVSPKDLPKEQNSEGGTKTEANTEPKKSAEPAQEAQPNLALNAPNEEAGTPSTSEPTSSSEAAANPAGTGEKPTGAADGHSAESEKKYDPLFVGWEKPKVAFLVTGQQLGYMEPCGCTGLVNQKGGLLRRHTLTKELAEKGWDVVPIDVGNQVQVKQLNPQASIKFGRTIETMTGPIKYQAIGIGDHDLKLPSTDIIQVIANVENGEHPFVCANVSIFGEAMHKTKVMEVNGVKIGITGVLGNEFKEQIHNSDVEITDAKEALAKAAADLEAAGCAVKILLAFTSIDGSKELANSSPVFDLVVTAGGVGEPTMAPEIIENEKKKMPMIQVGTKGMYAGVVGVFGDNELKYQRVPIDARFEDSDEVKKIFKEYQEQLENLGLAGLELLPPVKHSSGNTFVGSEACKDCHTKAYEIWKNGVDGKGGPHFGATESLVEPGERTWVTRFHDPECLSCHVTGWNTERHFPYEGGYLDLKNDLLLHGNGCENCHGPGSAHVEAENNGAEEEELKKLQQAMRVTKAEAEKSTCMTCHDLDNSPDFHKEGAFEKYWARIVHEGTD